MTYYIVYGFVKLLSLLPFAVLYALSDVFTRLFIISSDTENKWLETISAIHSRKNRTGKKKHRKEIYRHFCDLIFENIKFAGISVSEINKRMLYNNFEPALKHLDEGEA